MYASAFDKLSRRSRSSMLNGSGIYAVIGRVSSAVLPQLTMGSMLPASIKTSLSNSASGSD